MKINHLLVHLHMSISDFSLKPRHAGLLRELLPETCISVVENTEDFLKKLPDADCALVFEFKSSWYESAGKLKAVFTPAAGHDWVEADPSGRVKTCYSSFHGRIMRESLLAMMLYFSRQLDKSREDQKNRIWGRLEYTGNVGLFSQKALLVGFGALGQSMAGLLNAFGMKVVAVKRTLSGFTNTPDVDKVVAFDRLEEELPHADQVVILLPGGTETDGIITARHFNAMKSGAYLYNLGRGNCYREEDLAHALTNGPLAGAGLDVFAREPLDIASPLWNLPNVLITPHSSAISAEYIDLFIQEWFETLRKM